MADLCCFLQPEDFLGPAEEEESEGESGSESDASAGDLQDAEDDKCVDLTITTVALSFT